MDQSLPISQREPRSGTSTLDSCPVPPLESPSPEPRERGKGLSGKISLSGSSSRVSRSRKVRRNRSLARGRLLRRRGHDPQPPTGRARRRVGAGLRDVLRQASLKTDPDLPGAGSKASRARSESRRSRRDGARSCSPRSSSQKTTAIRRSSNVETKPRPRGRPRQIFAGKFGKFVNAFRVENLATELDVDPAAVYCWMRNEYSPTPIKAIAIVEIARSAGFRLTLEDIYVNEARQHNEEKNRHAILSRGSKEDRARRLESTA
jgi:hypothetical protein